MDLLRGKIRPLYFKYLSAAFGSALISSIYGIVDMAMVGQYQGPQGTAAMAVISPIWNIIYSLGLLMGIGGSVLLGTLRGEFLRFGDTLERMRQRLDQATGELDTATARSRAITRRLNELEDFSPEKDGGER